MYVQCCTSLVYSSHSVSHRSRKSSRQHGYDIGDDAEGLCCSEGGAVNRQVERGTNIDHSKLKFDRGSVCEGLQANTSSFGVVSYQELVGQFREYAPRAHPEEDLQAEL